MSQGTAKWLHTEPLPSCPFPSFTNLIDGGLLSQLLTQPDDPSLDGNLTPPDHPKDALQYDSSPDLSLCLFFSLPSSHYVRLPLKAWMGVGEGRSERLGITYHLLTAACVHVEQNWGHGFNSFLPNPLSIGGLLGKHRWT